MYALLQILTKLAITVVFAIGIYFFVLVIIRVWVTDVDLGKLFNPRYLINKQVEIATDFLPSREATGLYQNGQLVARSSSSAVDEEAKTITFREITNAEMFQLGGDFEFQSWRARCTHADTITMITADRVQDGKIIENATCSILGTR